MSITELCFLLLKILVFFHPVSGQQTSYTKDQFPSVLSIQSISKKANLCSATLVDPYHAITTARCIDLLEANAPRSLLKHFVGVAGISDATEWDRGYQAIPISETIKHPNYNGMEADIAMLTFKKPFNKSKVVKFSLKKVVIPEGVNIQIVGWTLNGYLNHENCVVKNVKMCQEKAIETIDFSKLICIGRSIEQFVPGLTDDPGSPTFYRNALVGIMSKSDPSTPGADETFLEILTYADFIKQYLPDEREGQNGLGEIYGRSQFPNFGLRLELNSMCVLILGVVSARIIV